MEPSSEVIKKKYQLTHVENIVSRAEEGSSSLARWFVEQFTGSETYECINLYF